MYARKLHPDLSEGAVAAATADRSNAAELQLMQRRRGALRLVAALLPLLAAAAAAPAGASIAAAAGGPADSAPHRGSVALSAGGDTLIARDDAYTVAAGQTLRPQTSADLLLANDELVPGPNAAAGPSAGAAGASGRRFWAQALLGQPSGSGGAVADLTPDGNFTFVPSAGWSGGSCIQACVQRFC